MLGTGCTPWMASPCDQRAECSGSERWSPVPPSGGDAERAALQRGAQVVGQQGPGGRAWQKAAADVEAAAKAKAKSLKSAKMSQRAANLLGRASGQFQRSYEPERRRWRRFQCRAYRGCECHIAATPAAETDAAGVAASAAASEAAARERMTQLEVVITSAQQAFDCVCRCRRYQSVAAAPGVWFCGRTAICCRTTGWSKAVCCGSESHCCQDGTDAASAARSHVHCVAGRQRAYGERHGWRR